MIYWNGIYLKIRRSQPVPVEGSNKRLSFSINNLR
jgi:hypothetical protein